MRAANIQSGRFTNEIHNTNIFVFYLIQHDLELLKDPIISNSAQKGCTVLSQ